MTVTIYFDGASRGNPGTSIGGGIIIADDQYTPFNSPPFIGTNNQAEYMGALYGILSVPYVTQEKEILLVGDSRLVLNQISGEWNCNDETLKVLLHNIEIMKMIHGYTIQTQWVPREDNQQADAICNQVLDLYNGE